jgi:small redox-active disulfide protein 2
LTVKTIQILGAGCPKCRQLAENAEAAARGLGIEFEIAKITDIHDIVSFGVMMTPGLVIDGEVKGVGKVASVEEIKALLR